MRNCKGCGKPIRHRLVFVTMDQPGPGGRKPEEVGPYGRECARKVVEGAAELGMTATRRREYVA